MAAVHAVVVLALAASALGSILRGPNSHLFPDFRIVGGEIAADGEAPFAMSLQTGTWIRSHFCGASLVAPSFAVTAAHCVDAVYISGISVGSLVTSLVGHVGSQHTNDGGVRYSFSRNYTHPDYDRYILKNDISLLQTTEPVALNDEVQVIPILFASVAGDTPVSVTGWGRVQVSGSESAELKVLRTTVKSDSECTTLRNEAVLATGVSAPAFDPNVELCTLHSAGNGNCHGDSGSALYTTEGKQQVGIVSWSFPCALGAPDFYTRVGAYQSWIRDVVGA